MAKEAGIPSLQVAVYPDPFDLETDAQLREKAVKILVPQIIDALTKPVPAPKESAAVRDTRAIEFTGTIDQINRYVTDKGWSDGLSITPPTIERTSATSASMRRAWQTCPTVRGGEDLPLAAP